MSVVITNAQEVSELHYDNEVDALYEELRNEFCFIRDYEEMALRSVKRQKEYLDNYRKEKKSTNSFAKRHL